MADAGKLRRISHGVYRPNPQREGVYGGTNLPVKTDRLTN